MNLVSLFEHDENIMEFQFGETIIEKGSKGDCMYVILEGEVDVKIDDQSIYTIGAGEIFGEMALIDEKPRSADVIAKTDCRLAKVNQKQFLFMVQQTPFFSLHIMRVMTERLRGGY